MELVRRLVSQGRVISTEEINRQRRHTSYNGFNLELATRMVPALRREGCLHAPHRQPRHGTPQTGRRWRRAGARFYGPTDDQHPATGVKSSEWGYGVWSGA